MADSFHFLICRYEIVEEFKKVAEMMNRNEHGSIQITRKFPGCEGLKNEEVQSIMDKSFEVINTPKRVLKARTVDLPLIQISTLWMPLSEE